MKNTVLGQCVILLVSPWAGTALCTVRLFSELLFKQEGAIVSNFVSAHEGWCDSEQILQTCAGEALFYSTCVSVLHKGCSRGRSFVLGGCVILVPHANYIQSATLEEVAAGKAWVFCLAATLSCPSFTDSRMPPSQLSEPHSQMSDSAACRSYSSCHITSLINSPLSVHMWMH